MTKIEALEIKENEDFDEFATIKTTRCSYCQSCGRDFKDYEVVFYALIDNNLICRDCIDAHSEVSPRLYIER
jgi:hypothetical protein